MRPGQSRATHTPRGEDTALVDRVTDTGEDERADRTRHIDASLTRLTAIHENAGRHDPDEDRDEDGRPGRRARKPAPPASPLTRRGLAGRVLAVAAALIVFAGLALGWGAGRWMDSTIRTVAALDPGTGVIDAATQEGDDNVLLLGTASGSSGDASPGGAGDRSDTLMMAHLPADGSRVVALTFPLDLEINRPPCPRWDRAAAAYVGGTVPAETRTPLSSAYAVGGPRCLVRTLQQLTGMPVTRFVALDLPGIKEMVDAVGGVDVCVARPVVDAVLGPIVPQAGTTRLDGDRAVRFAEAGAVQGDASASTAQVQRQQQLLAATFGQALSASTLLSPGATRDFAAALGRSMLADGAGVNDLLRVTGSLDGSQADGVSIVPLPVSAVPNTRGNRELRDTDAGKVFGALRKHQELPTSTPVASTAEPEAPAPQTAPGDVTVEIQNASDRDGLAGQVSGTLRALGFGIGEVGNAAPTPDTVLRFSPDRADAAQLLGKVVPGATLVQDPGSTGTLRLVLGSTFDGTVRAPVADVGGAGGSTPPAAPSGTTCG